MVKYYADPNSSFRNEIFYDQILRAQIKSKWYLAEDKKEIAGKFHLLHQNDIGNLANDFEFRIPEGKGRKLHDLEADQLLLFFYNPECDACKQMSSALKGSFTISTAVDQGRLKILCVYTDNDLSIWYRHLHEFPPNWIQGRDENEYLHKNGIYDLKAIPTIYLLDQNKKVILKDCTSIEELQSNIQ